MMQRILSFLFLFIGVNTITLQASCCGSSNIESTTAQNFQRDFPPLQDYINSKRSIPLKDKECNFSFGGDVRVLWANIGEKLNGRDLRGSGGFPVEESGCSSSKNPAAKFTLPNNVYELEYNMYIDYVCDRSWGVAWVQLANPAGVEGNIPCCRDPEACRGSGRCDNICLRKAYLGLNLVADGCFRIDVEFGRRPLWSVFHSYIQFQSRFDGALLRLAYNLCGYSDLYTNGGIFVIDERSHHYGGVVEGGYLNIGNTGIDLIYSYIQWTQGGANRCGIKNARGSQFANSQATIAYWFNPELFGAKTKIFAAGLINAAAKARKETDFTKQNLAWYAGFVMGEICLAGDWTIDITYQYVEAQAIPECDISGISNGNILGETFTLANSVDLARGRGNYKGWRLEGLYAITDNLTLDVVGKFSRPADPKIGGRHSYYQFLLQAIYAF